MCGRLEVIGQVFGHGGGQSNRRGGWSQPVGDAAVIIGISTGFHRGRVAQYIVRIDQRHDQTERLTAWSVDFFLQIGNRIADKTRVMVSKTATIITQGRVAPGIRRTPPLEFIALDIIPYMHAVDAVDPLAQMILSNECHFIARIRHYRSQMRQGRVKLQLGF